MSNTITVTGHLGRDAELKYTSNGNPVLELSIADTPRRKNRDTGEWEDAGDTVWFRASVWGPMAEALGNAGTAAKGAQVTVTGTLTVREYEHNGEKRTSHDVRVDTVGVREKRGATGTSRTPSQSAQTGGGTDPWAVQAPTAPFTDEPPF